MAISSTIITKSLKRIPLFMRLLFVERCRLFRGKGRMQRGRAEERAHVTERRAATQAQEGVRWWNTASSRPRPKKKLALTPGDGPTSPVCPEPGKTCLRSTPRSCPRKVGRHRKENSPASAKRFQRRWDASRGRRI